MELGVIGLGTMGASLARNAASNGAKTVVYNRTTSKTDAFMQEHGTEGNFVAAHTYQELVQNLTAPRSILIMVKAGPAVDAVIHELLEHLEPGDSIIDGGNSHYPDTQRRFEELQAQNIEFLGLGVSGGEEGALKGPSMMPGGSKTTWDNVQQLLLKMAAPDAKNGKCVSYLGKGGAGHFVKMVHNGIEYGVMQLIAESYDMLKNLGGYTNEELATLFSDWNDASVLGSFLTEITADIFTKEDTDSEGYLVDVIKDVAAQKGTGKWTTQAALDFGVAIPTITAAVDARIISGSTHLREDHQHFPFAVDEHVTVPAKKQLSSQVRNALKQSIICSYLQGFALIGEASIQNDWNINLAEVARIWEGGCIIRSNALPLFEQLFSANPQESQAARDAILSRFEPARQLDWRNIVTVAISRGIPVPAMAASLFYTDALRRERLPQSLIQAQRDYFGAHTFERTDRAGSFHSDW